MRISDWSSDVCSSDHANPYYGMAIDAATCEQAKARSVGAGEPRADRALYPVRVQAQFAQQRRLIAVIDESIRQTQLQNRMRQCVRGQKFEHGAADRKSVV